MSTERILRPLSIVLLLALVSLSAARAQNQGDEWDFSNIPVDDQALPYIGVGGGYVGMLSFIKYDELNTISRSLGLEDFSKPMILNGGGGFTAIYLIKNLRLGVYGAAGSKEVTGTVTIDTAHYKRTLHFGMGMTGVQIDYAIPLVGSLIAFPGFMATYNSMELEAIQTQAGDNVAFGNLISDTTFRRTNGTLNSSSRFSRSNLFLYPAVNLEYALTQFFLLRAGVGYSLNLLPGDWKTEDGMAVNNVPDIKANGLTVQFGVFVGLFQ
jgi:hypothetical protein